MTLFIGALGLCTSNKIAPPLFITFCQMFRRRHAPSARPSLLMFRIDCHIARICSCLCCAGSLAVVLSLWRRNLNCMNSSVNYGGCSRISHCQRRKRSVTAAVVVPCIAMKNDSVLYHQVSSFSPKSMHLQSLRQSERTTVRDLVQYKR